MMEGNWVVKMIRKARDWLVVVLLMKITKIEER